MPVVCTARRMGCTPSALLNSRSSLASMGPATVTATLLNPAAAALSSPRIGFIVPNRSRSRQPFPSRASWISAIGPVSIRPVMWAPIACKTSGLDAITVPAPSQTITAASTRPSRMASLRISEAPKLTGSSFSSRTRSGPYIPSSVMCLCNIFRTVSRLS
ncbi:Uncharacterised protein [uncultured archaeon]|nr:Uncharacterised protein [uncultured archaeon]